MKKLQIASDLSLPLDVVTEKTAFLGRTGSGKTYGAMKLAELMLGAGAQIGAIDPVGVWRALRVPAEKGGTSFDVVVFGGLYGDLPIEPTAAAGHIVADLVCDRGLSFVLDVSQMIPSEQQTFVRAFADRFFHRKKSSPSAVHLFMEECQEFIPENPSGQEAMTLGVMQRLWKLGRNFGIGGTLISQRPQEIAKKALNMSGTMFAFQMTGPQERAAVKKWVADHGIASDIESVLQKLRTGEPHVESPTFLNISKTIRILPRVTADLSSTPKVGASTVARRPLTPIDVEQLKESLAATIEKVKADDPKELKAKLAEAERTIVRLQRTAPAERVETKTVEKKVIGPKEVGRLEQLAKRIEGAAPALDVAIERTDGTLERAQTAVQQLSSVVSSARDLLTEIQKTAGDVRAMLTPAPAPPTRTPAPPARAAARPAGQAPVGPSGDGGRRLEGSGPGDASIGKSGLRRMLVALAQRPNGLTRAQLGVRAKVSAKGGSFDTYLSRARVNGWVTSEGDKVFITADGITALGAYEPLPEGQALLQHYLAQFGSSGAARMLQALADVHPKRLTRAELAEASGVSAAGGSFDTYLSRLRTLELVDGDRNGLKASDEFFTTA